MKFFIYLIIFCNFFCSAIAANANLKHKKAYIITGLESTGSVFISQVIAYVVGNDVNYKQWSGYGLNGQIDDDIVVLHRSQPYGRLNFLTREDAHDLFPNHELYFIICTRDLTIESLSIKRRFNRSEKEISQIIRPTAKKILQDIIQNEKYLIWNYETQQFLKETYFQILYDFLEVESDFIPPNLYDANKKYIK